MFPWDTVIQPEIQGPSDNKNMAWKGESGGNRVLEMSLSFLGGWCTWLLSPDFFGALKKFLPFLVNIA